MRPATLALAAWAAACHGAPGDADVDTDTPDTDTDTVVDTVDADADGWPASEDCDDTDPDSNPGKRERCDGVDNDCDGAIDEDGPMAWRDADSDGWGDPQDATALCDIDATWTRRTGDCDDENAEVHPEAVEVCNGFDDDCDPATSEHLLITTFTAQTGGGFLAENLQPSAGSFDDPGNPGFLYVLRSDIVAICQGTYYGSMTVSGVATVLGFGDPVLSGAGQRTPLTIRNASSGTVVRNLAMVDGVAERGAGGEGASAGGLIAIELGSVVLDNLTLDGGTADRGGAIFVGGAASVRSFALTVSNSSASLEGGAIYVEGGGEILLLSPTLHDNHAPVGAAVWIGPGTNVTLDDPRIADHAATSSAIYASTGSALTLRGDPGATSRGVVRTGGTAIRWGTDVTVTLDTVDFGTGADANEVDLQAPGPVDPLRNLGNDVTLTCVDATCSPR